MDDTPVSEERAIIEVKELRKSIDACIQEVEQQSRWGDSRALSIVKTKLEEAKMWGGKHLEELGSVLPKEYQDKAE